MKKLFIFFIAIITALFFTGCGLFNRPSVTEPPQEQNSEEKPSEPEIPEYEVIEEIDTLPLEIVEVIEYLKKQRGYFFFNPEDYSTGNDAYVLISAGEKPTGGYLVEVESLSFKNSTLEIIIEEKEPGVEEGVIQVITYPFAIVKLIDYHKNLSLSIINQEHRPFEEISPENIPSISKGSGIYIGQIDSNFIEIEVEGEAKAFMLENQELIQNLNEGNKIIFEYFQDDYNRLVIKNIEKTY